jgi:hypothetical protein
MVCLDDVATAMPPIMSEGMDKIPDEAGEVAFDMEAALASFLADPTRELLELPRLTTGQRKQAKKTADQHPELLCESFGFGAERRLHIFKKGGGMVAEAIPTGVKSAVLTAAALESKSFVDEWIAPQLGAMSVKNTFIDGWIPASEEGEAVEEERVVSRSMPVGLSKSVLETCLELRGEQADERASTSPSGASSSMGGSAPHILSELPVQQQEVRLRNTFIHFEASNEDDGRTIQSMPHGMFRQRLLEESAPSDVSDLPVPHEAAPIAPPSGPAPAAAAFPTLATAPAAPTSPAALPDGQVFFPDVGTEVVIEGLMKLPAFNGLSGVVQSWDEETGRYNVLLCSAVNGRQWAKLKADNLRPAVPPPPLYDAAVPTPLPGLDACGGSSSLKLSALI